MLRKFVCIALLLVLVSCSEPTEPSTVSQPVESPWENVISYGRPSLNRWVTDRMRVPGGWLYRQSVYDAGHGMAVSICFVPEQR